MSEKLKIIIDPWTPLAICSDIDLATKFLGLSGSDHQPDHELCHNRFSSGFKKRPTIERRLAVLVMVKAANFFDLFTKDDVSAVSAWMAIKCDILEKRARQYAGRVAAVTPGEMLLEFSSAIMAMRWAISVQRAIGRLPACADVPSLKLQMGVVLDEVIDVDGFPQGHGANEPSSIVDYAAPGGIVMTSTFYNCIKSQFGQLSAMEICPSNDSTTDYCDKQSSVWQLEYSEPVRISRISQAG